MSRSTGTPATSNDRSDTAEAESDALESLRFLNEMSLREVDIPDRQSDPPEQPNVLPEVPGHFNSLEPLTVVFSVTATTGERSDDHSATGDDEAAVLKRVVARTPDRVYLNFEGQGQEWLFKRNPLDHRRASGQLVDHREQVVLDFHEADLANSAIVRGWADVVTMGVTVEALDAMVPTNEVEEQFGIEFTRYVSGTSDEAGRPIFEVSWSEELALPLRVRQDTTRGSWVQQITAVEPGVNQDLFTNPEIRFTGYQSMDVVDWREEAHG